MTRLWACPCWAAELCFVNLHRLILKFYFDKKKKISLSFRFTGYFCVLLGPSQNGPSNLNEHSSAIGYSIVHIEILMGCSRNTQRSVFQLVQQNTSQHPRV